MKILMVNKFFFIKGGVERYFFELSEILKTHNHSVIPFSMKHPQNYSSDYEEFFIENIDYHQISFRKNPFRSLSVFFKMIYSLEAKRKMEKLIDKVKPDVAHLHMIDHQISPSILSVFHRHGIPVIYTAHHYKLVCPNYRLFNTRTQIICEKCLDGHYYHPLIERCHKNSLRASFMISVETSIHKLFRLYEDNIDIFHAPSHFMERKLLQAGIDKGKVEYLSFPIRMDEFVPDYNFQDYFVYYGRLSEEKGIFSLLKAMKQVRSSRLVLVGEGPERQKLEEFISKNQIPNVTFTGYKQGDELRAILAKAKFVVMPSEWYENAPFVIYESFAMGKPVIGSDLGGIPELIEHQRTGLIFRSGDVEMLAANINFLLSSDQRIISYGKRARIQAEKQFSPHTHYKRIMEKYNRMLKKR